MAPRPTPVLAAEGQLESQTPGSDRRGTKSLFAWTPSPAPWEAWSPLYPQERLTLCVLPTVLVSEEPQAAVHSLPCGPAVHASRANVLPGTRAMKRQKAGTGAGYRSRSNNSNTNVS